MDSKTFVEQFNKIMQHLDPDSEIKSIVNNLTDEEKLALQSCSMVCRRSLVRKGLAIWRTRAGHRYPSIRLNSLGYRVREYIKASDDLL